MHTAKDTQFILQLLVTASDPESQAMIKALLRWGVRGPSQTPCAPDTKQTGNKRRRFVWMMRYPENTEPEVSKGAFSGGTEKSDV